MSEVRPALAILPLILWFGACGGSGDEAETSGGKAGSAGSAGSAASSGTGGTGSSGGSGGTGSGAPSGGGNSSGGSGAGDASAGFDASPADAGLPDVGFRYEAPDAAKDACAAVTQEATLTKKPVDIIFIIDNSGSMTGEIVQVQNRIHSDFAQIIQNSGIDYRVIMISRYGNVNTSIGGSNNPICIPPPLGAGSCSNAHNTPLTNNPPRFFHYSADIESRDSLCMLLKGYSQPDELCDNGSECGSRPFSWTSLAPNGWGAWLRPTAFKTFVELTDDDVDCNEGGFDFDDNNNVIGGNAVAQQFDSALLALSSTQFGTAQNRNYNWYSIVGMKENSPSNVPWPATAPIQTGSCSPGSSGAGTGYQALSKLTGGLRWPMCQNNNFDAIFQAIAQGVVQSATVACDFDIPNPGAGVIDFAKVQVRYTPGSGQPTSYNPVAGAGACGQGDGFYYDNPASPAKILLCPTSCTTVQNDSQAKIDVLFGCLGS